MNLTLVQTSSLNKIRPGDSLPSDEEKGRFVLQGERFSYQICVQADERMDAIISVESGLKKYIQLYLVKDVPLDYPSRFPEAKEDYITVEPGLMPDLLLPAAEQNNHFFLSHQITTFWIRVDIPKDIPTGRYKIRIIINSESLEEKHADMHLHILPCKMPAQRLLYTRWFYADCIATQHHVDIYSEEHWELINQYIATARDIGMNMILVPVHTPPLDTAVNTVRPCTQLVDIVKEGNIYHFDFTKFRRFIRLCKNNGIEYFEIAHMFSQWGAKYAANILITENGKTEYLFGWHTSADSEDYQEFLKQYISAIAQELEKEGISEQTYFHISDEPEMEHIDQYRKAASLIKPLIGKSKTIDALSNYSFYEKGLVQCPVTIVSHIQEFFEHSVKDQWVYYCCEPPKIFTNCFLAMPSYRTRILGFLLYKYDIKGFLHWGFNFYNTALSLYPINPYITTSGDKRFPSGDPFIVYPGNDKVYSSIRGEVTYQAIQDMNLCFALEEYIGRKSVINIIDRIAGRDLRFDDYPRNKEFIEKLHEEIIEELKKYLK